MYKKYNKEMMKVSNEEIAKHVFNTFKSQMFYDPMIYKVIPHEASKKFNIDELTDEEIEDIRNIVISIDSSLG